ncbi:MAG: fimbrillin family protein [Muribaculaceae bacterium]
MHSLPLTSFAACVCLALALCGCDDDDLCSDADNGQIAFNIVSVEPSARAARSCCDSTFVIEGDSVPFSLTDRVNDCFEWTTPAASRGEYFSGSKPLTEMVVSGFTSDGKAVMSGEIISISDNKGTSRRFWPELPLSVLAYATSMDIAGFAPAMSGADCSMRFDYQTPKSADGSSDAEAQPDIVMAIAQNCTRADGSVPLLFHHALSALSFKIGTMPAGTQVKSISLANVYSAGSCVVTPAADRGITFQWSALASQQTYTQTYSHVIDTPGALGGVSQTFMLIPQATAHITLSITFTVSGREYTLSKQLNTLSITELQADHRYEFTIGITSDEVDVEVTDSCVGNFKDQLQIKNTGLANGYIRATIVGYWVNLSGDVVAPWNASDGSFAGLMGSNWVQSSTDGFYYYTQPVAPGATTTRLFESYTLTVAPPLDGAHLQLNILAQIVLATAVNDAWPTRPF